MGASAAGIGLALATVNFVGTYTGGWAGLGQGLHFLLSSHGVSRCMTMAILGPDFSGSVLVETVPEGYQN